MEGIVSRLSNKLFTERDDIDGHFWARLGGGGSFLDDLEKIDSGLGPSCFVFLFYGESEALILSRPDSWLPRHIQRHRV